MRIAVAQLNLVVGDADGNAERALDAMVKAEAAGADVLLLPELALPGYPADDLLLRSDFIGAQVRALTRLAEAAGDCLSIVGFAEPTEGIVGVDAEPRWLHNSAALLRRGRIVGAARKKRLPTHSVFDESRWFAPGTLGDSVVEIAGVHAGVLICEDAWAPEAALEAKAGGAQVLLVVNASPWCQGKRALREERMVACARATGLPLIYANQVGAQDGIVFDGQSFAATPGRGVVWRAPAFVEHGEILDLDALDDLVVAAPLGEFEETWAGLVCGLSDYSAKGGFSSVWVGLSGGIDSALTATLAVDALGPEAVTGVLMPSAISSAGSIDDARSLARRLGISTELLPIAPIVDATNEVLHGLGAGTAPFAHTPVGVAEENIQARVRAVLLMALANKKGGIVLATGNKSELSVGYVTLSGDMTGGFAVLADVPKTLVYALSRWRNSLDRPGWVRSPIPASSIEKPPSAELAPGQVDADALPPYPLLDAILHAYVDCDAELDEIVALVAGRDDLGDVDPLTVVERITTMVDRAEFKRRQAPPGIRISARAFGPERRRPITSGFRPSVGSGVPA